MIKPRSNEQYHVEAEAPLLRPGLKITVGPFSKRYAADAVSDLLEVVREINERESEKK
jgi:hypothetical protein